MAASPPVFSFHFLASYLLGIGLKDWLMVISTAASILLLILALYAYRLMRKLRQSELNQRELNQRTLAVVNHTDSSIISLRADGQVRLINKAAVAFLKKWIGSELKAGDNILKETEGSPAGKMWTSWLQKATKTRTWKEVSQIKIGAKYYYILESFSSITRGSGQNAGLVMVGNDITKEHEFNVQMAEQRDALEKSNKAKERMLSILAHDLKDGVYSALSMSQLVVEEPEEFSKEELLHLFTLLNDNFGRTQNLLESLLAWMKTQTGALEAKPSKFEMDKVIKEVFTSYEGEYLKKKIALELDLPENAIVNADREMIKTVIRNLISNALKYTHPEKGRVRVHGRFEDSHIHLHVEDNGRGISQEDQQKLLNSAGRYTTPGTANERGTGFGISLCKELLKLNKSELHLKSEVGLGTDFHFSLPVVDKNEPAPPPAAIP